MTNGSNVVSGSNWFCYLLATEGPLVVISQLRSVEGELLSYKEVQGKEGTHQEKRTVSYSGAVSGE